jgi:hypothetical protein
MGSCDTDENVLLIYDTGSQTVFRGTLKFVSTGYTILLKSLHRKGR